MQCVWTVLLTLSGSYSDLLDYVIFAVLLFYILTIAGVFVLRRTRPEMERPYRAFGYPVLPAVYMVIAGLIEILLLMYKPDYTWPGLIIVLLGVPVYFIWRRTATVKGQMANLLACKPLKLLLEETQEAGEHSLKRTLGVIQLTALGVGAIIGAGIFVMAGLGAHYAGPGLMLSFVLSGLGCAFAGLCYAEFAAMIPLAGSAYTYAYATLGEIFAWIIGWDLTLEYAMGASTVSSGWSNHFIELLNIFHLKMPLWLAYDHWTALRTAEGTIARQMAQASDASLVPGTQAFLEKVAAIIAAHSPELVQRAHELLNAPQHFRRRVRLQSAGLPDRPGDHRHPGYRHQGERAV